MGTREKAVKAQVYREIEGMFDGANDREIAEAQFKKETLDIVARVKLNVAGKQVGRAQQARV